MKTFYFHALGIVVEWKKRNNKRRSSLKSIDDKILSSLSEELTQILMQELNAGNRVSETYKGDWPSQGCTIVFLEKPFLAPIKRTLKDIVFRNINDPHYWKAEYYDKTTNQHLCCNFGDIPNFDDM